MVMDFFKSKLVSYDVNVSCKKAKIENEVEG